MQRENGRTVKQIGQTGEVKHVEREREGGGRERGREGGRGGREGGERGREREREGGREGGERKRKLIFFFRASEWQTSTKTPAPLIFL